MRPLAQLFHKQISKYEPIFPVLGKINGGNSLIKSFLSNKGNIIPTIEKPQL